MRSANLFGPLKGLCPHKALIGLTQASGLAGGFDSMMSASNVARNIAMVNRYWYHRLSVHKICEKGVAYKAKS